MRNSAFVLLFIFFAVVSGQARAEQSPILVKSRYFSVRGPAQMDVFEVLNKINYDYFLHAGTLLAHKSSDPKTVLGQTVDAILLESAKVLGINLYSFAATIEFFPDENTLKLVIRRLTGLDVKERGFYLDEQKTIYLEIDKLTAGVMGHEMAHALICHHFGAPPAANIQEILAGYVDYSLGKKTKGR